MKLFVIKGLQTRCWLAQVLTVLLALPPAVRAQAPAPPEIKPGAVPQTIQSLRIVPLAGNGETNDLERRIMAPLVVQVLDQNAKAVEGADVTFRFPVTGPSASFPNQRNSQTFRTNLDGQAAAVGWVANREVGTFQVRVTATRRNEIGETVISMANATRITSEMKKEDRKRWWSSKWFIIGVAAGAAGLTTGLVLANRNGGGPTVIVSPGTPSIGGGPQ